MNIRLVAAVIVVCQAVICAPSPLLAQENWGYLSRSERRTYHACLYASFINDYCHFHAWGSSEAAFRDCVIANGAGKIRIGFPYWRWGINDDCRALAQAYR